MRFLGLTVDRQGVRFGGPRTDLTELAKASVPATQVPSAAVGFGGGEWGSGSRSSLWGVIRESFAGAWQRNVTIDPIENILAFSSVYACLDLISKDISKLRPMLVQSKDGIWPETTNSAFSPVLRKPNSYQTRIQFFSQWILSKLIHGNTVVLKERDGRGIVTALHILNWRMVRVLVTEDGGVYYAISMDKLAQVQSITVPASEIIHDRAACLFHPLVGVPPIFACAMSASQGNRIQNNASKFFENMSRPSGMLTAPETISDETAKRLKDDFEANFSGANLGRLLVAGDNLKYEPMTIPAQQAQLIEQLAWTVRDVASCFHVPLYKLAGDSGVKFSNMSEMNTDYYQQTLHALIEDIEILLDEGLGLADSGPQTMGVMFDLEGLFRLDPVQRATRNAAAVKGGYWSPNEARATDNLPPVKGGEEPYLQQQNFPLSVLAMQPPPSSTPPAPAATDPVVVDPAADPAKDGAAKAAGEALIAVRALVATAEQLEANRVDRERQDTERRAAEEQSLTRQREETAARVAALEAERAALATEAETQRSLLAETQRSIAEFDQVRSGNADLIAAQVAEHIEAERQAFQMELAEAREATAASEARAAELSARAAAEPTVDQYLMALEELAAAEGDA